MCTGPNWKVINDVYSMPRSNLMSVENQEVGAYEKMIYVICAGLDGVRTGVHCDNRKELYRRTRNSH